ncbi:hypothetical protein [Amylibacter sp. SFDW26]|uniref:hypothetical protein n=1 Tax=Amylibacter sp. SFDW26 TaxID=2652722 RepID=UPI00186A2043|nr:hypothetical protein [Amylibacter sp. SFDW26]
MDQDTKEDVVLEETSIQGSMPTSKSPSFLTSALSYIQDNYIPSMSEESVDNKQD